MKIKKIIRRFCKKCNTHTEQTISVAKKRERSSLSHGSIARARGRGLGRGFGNLGKWGSKPAIGKWKRSGAKTSKRTDLRYKCATCNKMWVQRSSFRVKKLLGLLNS